MKVRNGAGEKRRERSPSLWFPASLILISILLLSITVACGRRGDPVLITPDEGPVVKDLRPLIKNGDVHLSWTIPEAEDSFIKALKGFIIFRAEVPEGTTVEECECAYKSIDFIELDGKSDKLIDIDPSRDPEKAFDYRDQRVREGHTYLYKIVIMDKGNKMGSHSNIAIANVVVSETKKALKLSPKAPTGLIGVFTQKNIVLTWDEVRDQNVRLYKIYRSEGKEFKAIGTTATSVFTDTGIKGSKKYYYRVTAIGDMEGPPSTEIPVSTVIH